jgi:hypothetical protein
MVLIKSHGNIWACERTAARTVTTMTVRIIWQAYFVFMVAPFIFVPTLCCAKFKSLGWLARCESLHSLCLLLHGGDMQWFSSQHLFGA